MTSTSSHDYAARVALPDGGHGVVFLRTGDDVEVVRDDGTYGMYPADDVTAVTDPDPLRHDLSTHMGWAYLTIGEVLRLYDAGELAALEEEIVSDSLVNDSAMNPSKASLGYALAERVREAALR